MSSAPDPTPDFLSELADSTAGRLLAADRRPVGQPWPTVPVPDCPEGVTQLDYVQTACALFEMCTDQLDSPPELLATDTLTAALIGAVRALGVDGLNQETARFKELDEEEFPEVGACRWLAHRLALTFWYDGARSRPMTTGEVAACLYASGRRFPDCRALTPGELFTAVHAGADKLTGPEVVTAGRCLSRDSAPGSSRPASREQRRCLHLARSHTSHLATPLVVEPDPDSPLHQPGPDGAVLLGASVRAPLTPEATRPLCWHW
ncbi:hypothetical protein ACFYMO_14435 [Streptomyces sp. NPDC007025]|uniref:hypothetical protein n=1 Tax=Streptomyces sp. NPDC007025 TaxID=3364771 RepID=UPI00369C2855